MAKMNLDKTKNIQAMLVFDIIGRPPEHLVEGLGKIIDEIDKEKGISVKNKKINEPITMKDRKDFYTTFAEVEVEVDEIINLVILMFKYMPAHIEIISPELIVLSNNSWSDILSEITRRLHGYEEIVRVMQVEKSILEKRLRELSNIEKDGETKKDDKINGKNKK